MSCLREETDSYHVCVRKTDSYHVCVRKTDMLSYLREENGYVSVSISCILLSYLHDENGSICVDSLRKYIDVIFTVVYNVIYAVRMDLFV